MTKQIEVTDEALFNLWLYNRAAHGPSWQKWTKAGEALVKAALTPGATMLNMYAMSVHVQQANGKIVVIEADGEFDPPGEIDGHQWKDNVPHPEQDAPGGNNSMQRSSY